MLRPGGIRMGDNHHSQPQPQSPERGLVGQVVGGRLKSDLGHAYRRCLSPDTHGTIRPSGLLRLGGLAPWCRNWRTVLSQLATLSKSLLDEGPVAWQLYHARLKSQLFAVSRAGIGLWALGFGHGRPRSSQSPKSKAQSLLEKARISPAGGITEMKHSRNWQRLRHSTSKDVEWASHTQFKASVHGT